MDKYINKEDAIERINRLFTKNHDGSVAKNDYNSGLYAAKAEMVFITGVDVLPARRGKWEGLVSRHSGLHYEVGALCSYCNEYTVAACRRKAMPFEFCPHCGADMRFE